MRRINVTLPEETIRLMNRVAGKGQRSRLVDRAVRQYVQSLGRAQLSRALETGAQDRADRDLDLVAEWFDLDREAWPSNAR